MLRAKKTLPETATLFATDPNHLKQLVKGAREVVRQTAASQVRKNSPKDSASVLAEQAQQAAVFTAGLIAVRSQDHSPRRR